MSARARLARRSAVVSLLALAERPASCRAAPGRRLPSLARRTVLDATLAKVVKIFGSGGVHNLEGYGTGLLVSPNGHVVTVWSHLLDSGDVSVVLNDGRRYHGEIPQGRPQARSGRAQRSKETTSIFPVSICGRLPTPRPGTRVLAFSNMFKVATGDEPVSVVHGVVAARARLSARRGAYRRRLRRAGLHRRRGDQQPRRGRRRADHARRTTGRNDRPGAAQHARATRGSITPSRSHSCAVRSRRSSPGRFTPPPQSPTRPMCRGFRRSTWDW